MCSRYGLEIFLLTFVYYSCGSYIYWYDLTVRDPHSIFSLHLNCCTSVYFLAPSYVTFLSVNTARSPSVRVFFLFHYNVVVFVSCHGPFLPDISLEGRVIPTAILSIWLVISYVQLSFVVNLLYVFLVWLPKLFLNLCYYSDCSSYYLYNLTFQVPHSLHLYT